MLLPPALVYAVGGVGVATLVGVIAHDRMAGGRRWIGRALIVVTAVAAAMTLVLLFGTARVARVTESPAMAVEYSLLLGSSTTKLGDKAIDLPYEVGTTIILNEARRPVQLVTVVYSRADLAFASPDPVPIDAMTMHVFEGKLDHTGPDDEPPDEFSSKSAEETKYWLTW